MRLEKYKLLADIINKFSISIGSDFQVFPILYKQVKMVWGGVSQHDFGAGGFQCHNSKIRGVGSLIK